MMPQEPISSPEQSSPSQLSQPVSLTPPPEQSRNRKRWIIGAVAAIVILGALAAAWYVGRNSAKDSSKLTQENANKSGGAESPVTMLELDMKKDYGNKYANGLLPVGDKKYSTSGGKKGSIYLCNANFVPTEQAGAQKRGPWFVNNNTQWDLNKKATIAGSVSWTPKMSVKVENGKRIVSTNALPNHKTGTYPVGSSDPARVYDANPNSIKEQSLTYTLDAAPKAGNPSCMGGEVGVMLTGISIFNGFDAGGRDAGAWEVQDGCDGHPQNKGQYHYHTLSRCITDTSVSTVIGYALDGFPITGPKVGNGSILTTDDLDECHGITSEVMLDGKKVKTYHYVMTQDFPYSVSCFRGSAVKAPGLPENPGGPTGSGTGTTGGGSGGTGTGTAGPGGTGGGQNGMPPPQDGVNPPPPGRP